MASEKNSMDESQKGNESMKSQLRVASTPCSYPRRGHGLILCHHCLEVLNFFSQGSSFAVCTGFPDDMVCLGSVHQGKSVKKRLWGNPREKNWAGQF